MPNRVGPARTTARSWNRRPRAGLLGRRHGRRQHQSSWGSIPAAAKADVLVRALISGDGLTISPVVRYSNWTTNKGRREKTAHAFEVSRRRRLRLGVVLGASRIAAALITKVQAMSCGPAVVNSAAAGTVPSSSCLLAKRPWRAGIIGTWLLFISNTALVAWTFQPAVAGTIWPLRL